MPYRERKTRERHSQVPTRASRMLPQQSSRLWNGQREEGEKVVSFRLLYRIESGKGSHHGNRDRRVPEVVSPRHERGRQVRSGEGGLLNDRSKMRPPCLSLILT